MAIEYSKEELHEFFEYDQQTGKLFWKVSKTNKISVGDEAGSINKISGYKQVVINGKNYQAHRIIAKMFLKNWNESKQVDHINHNKLDNRVINLRMVTNQENSRNASKYSHNTSGHHGISWNKRNNKWEVYCKVNGKKIFGGHYKKLEEAIVARDALYKKYGFHINHGFEKVS